MLMPMLKLTIFSMLIKLCKNINYNIVHNITKANKIRIPFTVILKNLLTYPFIEAMGSISS